MMFEGEVWAPLITSFTTTAVSEMGDRTFFTSTVFALKWPRWVVFLGTFSALTVQSLTSTLIGTLFSSYISQVALSVGSALLFSAFACYFGKEAWDERISSRTKGRARREALRAAEALLAAEAAEAAEAAARGAGGGAWGARGAAYGEGAASSGPPSAEDATAREMMLLPPTGSTTTAATTTNNRHAHGHYAEVDDGLRSRASDDPDPAERHPEPAEKHAAKTRAAETRAAEERAAETRAAEERAAEERAAEERARHVAHTHLGINDDYSTSLLYPLVAGGAQTQLDRPRRSTLESNDSVSMETIGSNLSGVLSASPRKWRIFGKVFMGVYVAELGDTSMLVTVTLAANKNPVAVFLGASLANALVNGFGIFAGGATSKYCKEWLINALAASLFAFYGLLQIFDLGRGALHPPPPNTPPGSQAPSQIRTHIIST